MSERERRLGLNEAVFREVNERITDIKGKFDLGTHEMDLICECGNTSCVQRISMSLADYEQIRADSLQFAIVPGHADDAVEVIISHGGSYDLVRKRPETDAATMAEQTDPRDD